MVCGSGVAREGACEFIYTQSMHLCTVCVFHYTVTASDVTCHVHIIHIRRLSTWNST